MVYIIKVLARDAETGEIVNVIKSPESEYEHSGTLDQAINIAGPLLNSANPGCFVEITKIIPGEEDKVVWSSTNPTVFSIYNS